jgi:hypothetical protein
MCESGRFRTATEWEKDTEGLDCIEGEIAKGRKRLMFANQESLESQIQWKDI